MARLLNLVRSNCTQHLVKSLSHCPISSNPDEYFPIFSVLYTQAVDVIRIESNALQYIQGTKKTSAQTIQLSLKNQESSFLVTSLISSCGFPNPSRQYFAIVPLSCHVRNAGSASCGEGQREAKKNNIAR